jgi:DNA mismatch repair protein MutS2
LDCRAPQASALWGVFVKTQISMDDKTLQTLEYFKILERLAGYTAFSASHDRALELRPTDRLELARDWQAETAEAVKFLVTRPDMTIGGARDIRASVELAYRNGVLQPTDLLDIKSTLIAARTLSRTFEHLQHQFPRLYSWAAQLHPPTGLVEAITRAIDERGQILDSASPKLAQIRRDMRIAYDRLMTKLQRMLTDSSSSSLLQEAIITQRDGRYVIPLRSEFKGRIKSIVHDQSASGATLFVEPLAVVELNNEYRELQLAERDEERRILAELSAHVADNAELLLHMLKVIAEIDFILARAKYAEDLNASEPLLKAIGKPRELGKVEVVGESSNQPVGQSENQQSKTENRKSTIIRHPGTIITLIEARHPLLDRDTVVPIDVELDPHTFVMVVTGPNTGGKTVSLKTIGLLILMAQSGLHIPAHSGSELTMFKSIYADIGDEQSIEQSLSTFSGHVKNIIRILKRADRHSLVILDELGAGTDPQEGAALARALLSHLLREGVTTLVTTHHPELKAYAHGAPGAINASVEFDLKTLRPTYRLTIGLPGRSNALAIAKRLGLPDDIIEDARSELNPDDLRAESMLDEIHRQREAARKARGNADRERHQADKLRTDLAARLDKIEEERRAILDKARHEAEKQMEALQAEIADLRRELTRARQPLDVIKQVEEKTQELAEETATPLETAISRPIPESKKPSNLQPATLSVGSKVHLRTLNTKGVITSLGEDEAEVQVGMLRIRTRLADIQPTSGDPAPEVVIAERPSTQSPNHESPGLELDLRGQTAEEALEQLDRYLESAYLSGLPWVRIIHGKGTGKLRLAVRDALQHHPHVKSFETGGDKEGGEGVTVAKLHAE